MDMGKIRILIADDNVLNANLLSEKLCQYHDFKVISIAKDGLEAVELIEKEKPDVVLLDIIMPKLDGIGVLEFTKNLEKDKKPIFIIYTAVSRENYVSRAMNLGADYYIIKPFEESVIATRIKQLFFDRNQPLYSKSDGKPNVAPKLKNRYDDELKTLATKYMREYGLKAHMTGYSYIRDIVTEAFDCYCRTGALPKGIYREIAVKNNVPIQKVERAIRNCIESVAVDGDNQKRPTNSQVICRIIEKIRLNN